MGPDNSIQTRVPGKESTNPKRNNQHESRVLTNSDTAMKKSGTNTILIAGQSREQNEHIGLCD